MKIKFYLLSSFIGLLILQSNVRAQTPDKQQSQKEKIEEDIQEAIERKLHLPLDQATQEERNPDAGDQTKKQKRGQNDYEKTISDDLEPESEVHAAINPTDSSNIIVSPIRRTSTSLTTPIYYTHDYGQTWHKSSFEAIPDKIARNFGGGDPVFTFDANGKAYFTWISLGVTDKQEILEGIYWASSEDGGKTWELESDHDIVEVSSPSINNLDYFYDKQWLTVDRTNSQYRNNIYVTYTNFNRVDNERRIEVKVKEEGEQHFDNTAIDISDNLQEVQFTDIQVAPDGSVHCIFFGRSPQTRYGLFHAYSTDGGETFSNPEKISEVQFPGHNAGNHNITGIQTDRLYPCPHLAIDHSNTSSRGNMYVVWSGLGIKSEKESFNVYFSKSEDGGNSWSSPKTIPEDDPENQKFYPSIAVNSKGLVTVSWYQQVDAAMTHYYIGYSRDAGATFENKHSVSSAPTNFNTVGRENSDFGIGEYTKVLSTSTHAIPIWADGRDNNGDLNIMTAFIPYNSFGVASTSYGNLNKNFKVEALYPNPAKNKATVTLSLAEPDHVQVQLTTLKGKNLKMIQKGDLTRGKHEIAINLENLDPGHYFLKVQTEQGLATKPVQVIE